jgi:hypothetical protein
MTSKILFVSFLFCGGMLSAQVKSEKQVVKNEIKKEVSIEEENGVKTLTIRTSSNGTESVEVYKGQEAEQKIAEMDAEMNGKVEEKVYVEEINGVKSVKIERTENGVTTTEQYQGEEADKKLKEMESKNPEMSPKNNQRQELRKELKINKIEKSVE